MITQALVEGVENWKHQLLEKWEPDQTITVSLKQIQQNALDLTQEESFIGSLSYSNDSVYIGHSKRIMTPLLTNGFRNKLLILVENNHEQIGDLVQENLDKLRQ